MAERRTEHIGRAQGGLVTPRLRKLYPFIRWGCFLASIAFLVSFAHATIVRAGQPLWPLLRGALGETALSSVFFVLAALATVPAWRALLHALGVERAPMGATLRIFSLTQIAKYLPGNVGHHIGRVALARTHLDISAATTTISLLQEGALVVAAAIVVGAGMFLVADQGGAGGADLRVLLAAALVGGFGTLLLANRYRPYLAGPDAPAWRALLLRAAPTWRAVARALPWHLLVHVLNGVALACIASAVAPLHATNLALLTGAYALSWVLGFLLPGAPGGLGVRESALVLLAGSAWPPDALLAIATLSRIGSIVADLLIFLCAVATAPRRPDTLQVNDRNHSE